MLGIVSDSPIGRSSGHKIHPSAITWRRKLAFVCIAVKRFQTCTSTFNRSITRLSSRVRGSCALLPSPAVWQRLWERWVQSPRDRHSPPVPTESLHAGCRGQRHFYSLRSIFIESIGSLVALFSYLLFSTQYLSCFFFIYYLFGVGAVVNPRAKTVQGERALTWLFQTERNIHFYYLETQMLVCFHRMI